MGPRDLCLAIILLAAVLPRIRASCAAQTDEAVKCGTHQDQVRIVKASDNQPYTCQECVPVGCHLPNGWEGGVVTENTGSGQMVSVGTYTLYPAQPGEMRFKGQLGVVAGTTVTIQCNPFYGVVHSQSDSVATSDAVSTFTVTCEESSNCAISLQHYCRPKICGDFVVPGDVTATISSDFRGTSGQFTRNTIIFGVAFKEEIRLECDAGSKMKPSYNSDQLCSIKTHTLTCEDNLARFANWQPQLCGPCCTGSIIGPINTTVEGNTLNSFPVTIQCLEGHRLDLQEPLGNCETSYEVRCGDDGNLIPTGYKNGVALDSPEVACVPIQCDADTARDGTKYSKFSVVQDVSFDARNFKQVTSGQHDHDEFINITCIPDSYAVYEFSGFNGNEIQFEQSACTGPVCTPPKDRFERRCIGDQDHRRCMFQDTPACVKSCGDFTIPGNATGTRNQGNEIQSNVTVTRLVGFEVLKIKCDQNFKLNVPGCQIEADLSCDAFTGTLSSGLPSTPAELACVPIQCDADTARDGTKYSKFSVVQDVSFDARNFKQVTSGQHDHDEFINITCIPDSYAVYEFSGFNGNEIQFEQSECTGPVCTPPKDRFERRCIGDQDHRRCMFQDTPACVKSCGDFTIPGNATGTRNQGNEIQSNVTVTRLVGFEVLKIKCDQNFKLNVPGCQIEADLSCDAFTGTLSSGLPSTPAELACVPIQCDADTARDGTKYSKFSVVQDVSFDARNFKQVTSGQHDHDEFINITCIPDSYAVYEFSGFNGNEIQFEQSECTGPVCTPPKDRFERRCIGDQDHRRCMFQDTPACVKSCGDFTIPGNATGTRNQGNEIQSNVTVTRLVGFEVLKIKCDQNFKLNVPGCQIEADLSCDAFTGTLSSGLPSTPAELACVRRCECGDGIRDSFCNSEQCDDGNSLDGDGCSSRCTIENGWTCLHDACSPSDCSQDPISTPPVCPVSLVDFSGGVMQPSEGTVSPGQTVDVKCNQGNCCYPATDPRCMQLISGTEALPLREGFSLECTSTEQFKGTTTLPTCKPCQSACSDFDGQRGSNSTKSCQCSWSCPASANMLSSPVTDEQLPHEDHFGYSTSHTAGFGNPGPHSASHVGLSPRSVTCASGYELVSVQDADPRASVKSIRRNLPGSLASLGSLPVFARQSFNQPTAGTAAKMSLSGEFSDVSVDLPAGAWPASAPAGQLFIMVFELPSSLQRRHVVKAGTQPLSLFGQQEIAGKAVYFGPEGVKFATGVTISVSVDQNLDMTGKVLKVFQYLRSDTSVGGVVCKHCCLVADDQGNLHRSSDCWVRSNSVVGRDFECTQGYLPELTGQNQVAFGRTWIEFRCKNAIEQEAWIELLPPEDYVMQKNPSVVKGLAMSFSAFVAVLVPELEEAQNETKGKKDEDEVKKDSEEKQEAEEDSGLNTTQIVLIAAGAVVVTGLALALLIYLYNRKQRQSYDRMQQEVPQDLNTNNASFSILHGDPGPCVVCGQDPATGEAQQFRRCAQCKAQDYCSEKCQRVHWQSGHQLSCVPVSDRNPQSSDDVLPSESQLVFYQTPSSGIEGPDVDDEESMVTEARETPRPVVITASEELLGVRTGDEKV